MAGGGIPGRVQRARGLFGASESSMTARTQPEPAPLAGQAVAAKPASAKRNGSSIGAGASEKSGTQPAAATSKVTAGRVTAAKVTGDQVPARKASAAKVAASKARTRSVATARRTTGPSRGDATSGGAPTTTSATAPARTAPPGRSGGAIPGWTVQEFAAVWKALRAQAAELRGEIENAETVLASAQRDSVGEGPRDDAEAGAKTFEREHEMSLANNAKHLLRQVERAQARLADGTFGRCEICGTDIPKARLHAFPRVTLCVTCKQHEERR